MSSIKIEGEKIILNPIPRAHGHMEVTAELTGGIISTARISGLHYRGIAEKMKGRPLSTVPQIVSRCCGNCSISHLSAATKAQEHLCRFTASLPRAALRELLVMISVIMGHLQHFYLDILPDYIAVENTEYCPDSRFDERIKRKLLEHREQFIASISETWWNIGLITGKRTHGQGIYFGGGFTEITPNKIFAINKIINTLQETVKLMISDTYLLSERYDDYFLIGEGNTNFIDFGFPQDKQISNLYCTARGKSPIRSFDAISSNITIDDTRSWLCISTSNTTHLPTEEMHLDFTKPNAYSSLFSAGYNSMPYEMGALARQQLIGTVQIGVSAMDRIIATAYEANLLCSKLNELTQLITSGKMNTASLNRDISGVGIGISPTCAGSVIHIVKAQKGLVRNYNIISPCHWNLAPKDKYNNPSPLETALVGIEAPDIQTAQIQIIRTVRSFAPCIYCGG
ncbi:MAG: nickel-dependent hydrogenase large subunit [Oscillospiraceae bacterium]